jgi:hypothetical protein
MNPSAISIQKTKSPKPKAYAGFTAEKSLTERKIFIFVGCI